MTKPLTVQKIGDSLGVIFGADALAELGIAEGDVVLVVRAPDDTCQTSLDPDFTEALEAGRDYMGRHPSALRELAR